MAFDIGGITKMIGGIAGAAGGGKGSEKEDKKDAGGGGGEMINKLIEVAKGMMGGG